LGVGGFLPSSTPFPCSPALGRRRRRRRRRRRERRSKKDKSGSKLK